MWYNRKLSASPTLHIVCQNQKSEDSRSRRSGGREIMADLVTTPLIQRFLFKIVGVTQSTFLIRRPNRL